MLCQRLAAVGDLQTLVAHGLLHSVRDLAEVSRAVQQRQEETCRWIIEINWVVELIRDTVVTARLPPRKPADLWSLTYRRNARCRQRAELDNAGAKEGKENVRPVLLGSQ